MERTFRRAAAVLGALALALSALVAAAPPAFAEHAPPWRWKTVFVRATIEAQSLLRVDIPCPAGYLPITGSWQTAVDTHLAEFYPDFAARTYLIEIFNRGSVSGTVFLEAECAHAEDIGGFHTEGAFFGRNSAGFAGGTVLCPDGFGTLTGGHEWLSAAPGRRVNYSAPTPIGDGWYVSGFSPQAFDRLYVEVYCLPNAILAGSQYAFGEATGTGTLIATAPCPPGTRVMTRGAKARPDGGVPNPGADLGSFVWLSRSGVQWTSVKARVGNLSTTVRAEALCVPVAVPTLTVTDPPPSGTVASAEASFAFTASDTANEDLSFACSVDSQPVACAPDTTTTIRGLSDGSHDLMIRVTNTSEQFDIERFTWTVDTTGPQVVTPPPATGAAVTAPIAVEFDELARKVTAATFTVRVAGTSTPLAGTVRSSTVGDHTRATWTPSSPLVPGQRYTVALNGGIEDLVGNALSPVSFPVRATTTVENTSVALVERWDPDTSSLASDGSYISSSSAGSFLTRAFTVPSGAGQRVGVWGIRTPSGGLADVRIDGVSVGTASFYADSAARARVFLSEVLPPGKHTVSVVAKGQKPAASSGTWVSVDNLAVGSTVLQQGGLSQRFRRLVNAAASGQSYDVVRHATGGDTGGPPSYSVTFNGDRVRVVATRTPASGSARIYIDGTAAATVDLRSDPVTYQATVFDKAVPAGLHTVRIVPIGSTSGALSDAGIDVLRFQ